MSLEKYLQELVQDAAPPTHAGLAQLSDLTDDEVDSVRRSWPLMAEEKRLEVVSRLEALAEDTVDLDFSAVFAIALKDETPEVRQRAILGLWECEERHLITLFISLLNTDPSEEVRGAAALALGNFAELAEDGKLLPKDHGRIKDALTANINDPLQPTEVRRRALEALGALSDDDVLQLIMWAYEHPEERFRQSAVYTMGRNSSPDWLPTILRELESDDPAMRYEAASACGELGDEAAVPHLLPLLEDDDSEVCISALNALGSIGGSSARRALTNYANSIDGDEAVAEAAQEALAALEANADPLSLRNRL